MFIIGLVLLFALGVWFGVWLEREECECETDMQFDTEIIKQVSLSED